MFNYNHYVPLLKGKRGEFGALAKLSQKVKPLITPFIDVPRVSRNDDEGADIHLIKIVNNIKTSWGTENTVFVDLADIDLTQRTADGTHPVIYLFGLSRAAAIRAIPCTGLDRDSDYNNAIATVLKEDNSGVCIRVVYEDMDSSIEELSNAINDLLGVLAIPLKDVHLLLDFKDIRNSDIAKLTRKAVRIIDNLPDIASWKTLTIAASGYPDSLSSVKGDSTAEINRLEFLLWRSVIADKTLKRRPSFGDYGIVHPILLDLDPITMRSSAKIRYTLGEKWLVVKGHSLKKEPKFKQYHNLSDQLITMKEFIGSHFCWGDEYVTKCAIRTVGSGNLETWVKVDTNHHLTFVAEQIANTALS